jgi:2-hydroxy-6-oxonona-2,4-dienedioate hydrolase
MTEPGFPSYTQTYVNTGEGQVVILLHGIFGNVHIWRHVVEALKDDFRVIVPRIPISDLPLEDANVKYIAQVLHRFIEHHQLENVTLVGHAVGGQLALMYTHLYPANVRKLVLVSSAGLMERSPLLKPDVPIDFQSLQEEIEEAFYLKEYVDEKLVEEIYEVTQDESRKAAIGEIARSSKRFRVSTILGKIDHPVLLIWGLNDPISPPESALHFNDLLFNSEVKFIEACGHVPMLEKPSIVTQHLLTFLKPHSGSAWYDKKH